MRSGKTNLADVARRYTIALATVVVSMLVRFALADSLSTSVPYITLYPGVMFAAWFGGIGPGIFATILSVIAASYYLIPPLHRIVPATPEDWARAIVFTIASIFISALNEAIRRAHARNETRLNDLTDETIRRRRVEETLDSTRQQAERDRDLLLTTLSSIGDAVIATDALARVTFMNAIAQELTGWPLADAQGKPSTEVFVIRNEKTGQPAINPIETVIRDGVVVTLANHTVLLARDGREVPIEDSAAPIRDDSQKNHGVVLVFRDVTARRRAQNELLRSEERLNLALRAGQIGVWDWDIQNNRIEWSELVYVVHGLSHDQFDGTIEDYARHIYPEDRPKVEAAITKTLREDAPYNIEFRILRGDGIIGWVSTTAHMLRNPLGEPTRMIGATSDITSRKESEAVLLRQWHTFDAALSNSPDFTYIFDTSGCFTYVNRALLALWEKPLEDAVGKNFFDLGYPDDLAGRLQRQIQMVIDTNATVRDTTPFTGPTGETRDYEYIFVPIWDAHGNIEAVAGSTRDITERSRAQAELSQSNLELQRVNRELEEFAYVASHDLQEPLRMVNIYTQLLLNDTSADDANKQQYAAFVKQGVDRMEVLIHDLLTFSRAVHDDEEVSGTADLAASLKEALSVLKNRIEEECAAVIVETLPVTRGNTSQLAHVFQNLLSNALKYRKPNVLPRIHISAEQIGDAWTITVRDNGIGFDQQYAERIFGLFKRLHKDEYPGTGLGLAICKRIVERYDGRVWAESQPGEGAAFRFSLPSAR